MGGAHRRYLIPQVLACYGRVKKERAFSVPVSSAMKFRGKPAIDTLYVRLGDGLAAITVLVGVQLLALSTSGFFVFNVILVLCWLIAGVLLVREHRRASLSAAPRG